MSNYPTTYNRASPRSGKKDVANSGTHSATSVSVADEVVNGDQATNSKSTSKKVRASYPPLTKQSCSSYQQLFLCSKYQVYSIVTL